MHRFYFYFSGEGKHYILKIEILIAALACKHMPFEYRELTGKAYSGTKCRFYEKHAKSQQS